MINILILTEILLTESLLVLFLTDRTFNFSFSFSSSSGGGGGSFFLLLRRSLDVADLGALLAVVDRAAGWEVSLGVGPVLDQGAAGAGLQVHHGAAVRHLLCQPAGLQLDTLGGATEGSQGPTLPGTVDLALGGGEATVTEI